MRESGDLVTKCFICVIWPFKIVRIMGVEKQVAESKGHERLVTFKDLPRKCRLPRRRRRQPGSEALPGVALEGQGGGGMERCGGVAPLYPP